MTSVGLDDRALFLRRLAWDDLTPERAAVVFETWSGPADPHQSDAIQEWLRASSPISARSDGPSPPTVSFAELWQRIASGAMAQLLKTFRRRSPPVSGRSPLRKCQETESTPRCTRIWWSGWPEPGRRFSGRCSPGGGRDQIVFAHLGDSPAAPGQVRRSITAACLRSCAETPCPAWWRSIRSCGHTCRRRSTSGAGTVVTFSAGFMPTCAGHRSIRLTGRCGAVRPDPRS